jgi:putative hydrolase of the HAD superfamily
MDRTNSSTVKAVILDYGEVLSYPPTAQELGRMAGVFGLEAGPFRKLWSHDRLRYDHGDLCPEAYWSALAKQAGTHLRPEQITELQQWDLEMWGHENPAMVEWLKQIHASGLKTALLSNMPHEMIRTVRRRFAWLEYFDHQTFSAEVSMVKPDPAIYEHSLRGVGVTASEALFVDDKEPNVQGARAVGIRTIQFQSMAQFRNDLMQMGFAILPVDSTSSAAVTPVRAGS